MDKTTRRFEMKELDWYFLLCLVVCLLVIIAVLCISLFVPPPARIIQRWDGAEVQRWGRVIEET